MGKRKSPSTGRASPGLTTRADGRVRPTNNQLLYKAHLRWDRHYAYGANPALNLPRETPGFPSVTSCFLRVLCALQKAEEARCGRSILNILSTNTRRTKVVELSSGTHRVPDELRKHYLSDALGGQYSTNLDRNRYGQDDNYLFTVIRYDLEFLSLCPCLVDVEIVDVKMGNQSILVSAGDEYCKCNKAHSGCADSHEPSAQAASSSQTPRRGRAAAIAPQLTTLPGGAACAHGTAQPSITSMDAGGKLPDLTQAHPFAWDPSLLSLGGPLSLPGFPGSLQPHSHPLMQPTPGNAQHLHGAASGSGGLHAPPGLPHGLSLPPRTSPTSCPPSPSAQAWANPTPPACTTPACCPPTS